MSALCRYQHHLQNPPTPRNPHGTAWYWRRYPFDFAYANFVPLGWVDARSSDSFYRLQFYYFRKDGAEGNPYGEKTGEAVLLQVMHTWSRGDELFDGAGPYGVPWAELYHETDPDSFRTWLARGIDAGCILEGQSGEILFDLATERGGE